MRCSICGASTDKVVTVRSGFPVYECVRCRSLTVDCPYQADQYDESYQFFQLPDNYNDSMYTHYAHKALALAAGGRILDVGCGTGRFLRSLRTLDPSARVHGYDISRSAVAHARGTLPADVPLTSDLGKAIGWGKFDLVTSLNVIEHVPDVPDHVRCLVQWLKLAAFLMVSTPNLNAINRWRMGFDKWDMIAPPVHLRILSARGLRGLFAANGLDVVHRSSMSWAFVSKCHSWRQSWRWLIAKMVGGVGMGGNLLMIGRRKADSAILGSASGNTSLAKTL